MKETGLTFFGGYDPEYPRNAIIRKGWRRLGLPLQECRVDTRRKVHVRYPLLLGRFVRRGSRPYPIFVPDFRHKDVPLAWALARLRGVGLVFDPLVSRYETRVLDRGDAAEGSVQAWHNRNIDRISLALPDLVLADTSAHGDFFARTFGVARGRVETLHIGYDDELFKPSPAPSASDGLDVLFYGSYLPLHGVGTIIDAVSRIHDTNLRFTLIGEGQTHGEMVREAARLPAGRVRFLPRVPQERLFEHIERSHIVLGIFGGTRKAAMVIPNKVYQALAVGRAVVTADTPAVRELFENGTHLVTVPPADPQALARAISDLAGDATLRDGLAARGGAFVRESLNPERVATRLREMLVGRGLL